LSALYTNLSLTTNYKFVFVYYLCVMMFRLMHLNKDYLLTY